MLLAVASLWRLLWGGGRGAYSQLWLRRIFAVTLIAVGGRMWFSDKLRGALQYYSCTSFKPWKSRARA